jgi:hypothetical protein
LVAVGGCAASLAFWSLWSSAGVSVAWCFQIIERQGPLLPDQLALKAANALTDKQVP